MWGSGGHGGPGVRFSGGGGGGGMGHGRWVDRGMAAKGGGEGEGKKRYLERLTPKGGSPTLGPDFILGKNEIDLRHFWYPHGRVRRLAGCDIPPPPSSLIIQPQGKDLKGTPCLSSHCKLDVTGLMLLSYFQELIAIALSHPLTVMSLPSFLLWALCPPLWLPLPTGNGLKAVYRALEGGHWLVTACLPQMKLTVWPQGAK